MTKAPEITVLMPVFNSEKYLREAIDSILSQSYTDFELIVIDDGSTDNSNKIIRSFTDKRIRLIENTTNLGLISTLNKGFSLAKGNYIARMDADDISLPNRLKKQISYLQKNSTCAVCATNNKYLFKQKTISTNNWFTSNEIAPLLLFTATIAHPTVMMRTDFIKKNNLQYDTNFKHAEDYKLWTDVIINKGEIHLLEEELLLYRIHDTQITSTKTEEQKIISNKIRECFLSNLGIQFSSVELETHSKIGNNVFLQSTDELLKIEEWLIKLSALNKEKNIFNTESLNKVIGKLWLDSCGNTNLGVKAIKIYLSSSLKKQFPISILENVKFVLKCILRGIKNKR
ncbi:MAG: glycosyltransferase family 2 protein [Bacteroidetes bacterium]|nr:glycosyltransferase family 2 protein [Bacteroidota bacterium]